MTFLSRQRFMLAAAATALALGGGLLLPQSAANAGTTGAAQAPRQDDAQSYDITLITGDVVHYREIAGGNDVVTVDRPEGATGGVHIQRYGEDTYVLPTEVLPLLAADRVDQRLFNITDLAAMQLDDKHADAVPLIAAAPKSRSAQPPATPKGAAKVRTLESIGATALKADKDKAHAFWEAVTPGAKNARTLDGGIGKLWLDGRVKASLSESVPQVGAPQAWAKGFDGSGTKVAVLDTGIDPTHPDVKDRIVGTKSFIPGEEVTDGHGHGTHVASTIGGSGAAAGGAMKGVAPGAGLLVGKVLANGGYGSESGVVEGMEWAKAQGADVVSMSLGSQSGDDGNSPEAQAVNALSANGGPLFVIAAGNSYSPGTVGSPGSAASALTVAAVDKTDKRAEFSSQGPLLNSYALKPDISAPGVAISAAASQAVPGWTGGMYRSMSGTSMATPHVAGAAAILKQRHPDWDGQRIKNALMSTSKKLDAYAPYAMGTGRLDVAAAIDTTIEATGSVPAAVYKWPYEGAQSTERTVTYRNTGTADVTLNLALDTQDPAYTLSATTVTVPAGGTAEAKLTLDPAKAPANTSFSGQILATDATTGAVAAHTGFALHKERELYDYTVELKDRAGKPATGYVALTWEGNSAPYTVAVSGRTTLRLPPGTYTAWSYLDVEGDRPDSLGVAFLTAPETVLDRPTTVTLDASKARPADVRAPKETEVSQTILDYHRMYPNGTGTGGIGFDAQFVLLPFYDTVYLSPTEKVTKGEFTYMTRWRLREEFLDAETGSGHDVQLTGQNGTAFKDGRSKFATVYAGKGAAADYAGLDARGKAVIVERSDEVDAKTRAQNATAAGAAMLVSVNDRRGNLYEGYGSQQITVASVRAGDGARLITEAKSGRGILRVDQKRFPDYVYDLTRVYRDAIPDRALAYSPSEKDLAKVTSKYYGHKATLGAGFRFYVPVRKIGGGRGVGLAEYEAYPAVRTEYVTPQEGSSYWYENHRIGSGYFADHELRGDRDRYQAGRTYTAEWFAPVQHPRFGYGYVSTVTDYPGVQINVPMWSDSGRGHSGAMPNAEYDAGTIALYDGDTLVRQQVGRAIRANLPRETKPYRVVAQATRDKDVWRTSTKVRTEYGFTHHPNAADDYNRYDLKLLNLSFDVPTDLRGDAEAGRALTIGLGAETQHWFAGEQFKGESATLSVSYDDGATWRDVPVVGTAKGRWTAKLTMPDTPGAFVSLRASAKGPDGLSVGQEIIRAFGLK
ncbi:S8 family serine peptidase [Streptomyces sp. NPDC097727]|uniref:S8 family serine peptidase n=1 Tax=Streptomyces sp. NPDC097727 TaxID=3366092 RepID=UPI00380FA58E